MTTENSKLPKLPPQVVLPTLNLRLEFMSSVVSLLLAVFMFYLPTPPQDQTERRYIYYIVGTIIVVIPLLIPIVVWRYKKDRATKQIIHDYPELFQYIKQQSLHVEELEKNFFEIFQRELLSKKCEIKKANYINKQIYISIYSRFALQINDVIGVLSQEDNSVMGIFKITEKQKSNYYYAVATTEIDALWKGYIVENGEVTMFPNLVAVSLPQGENYGRNKSNNR